MYNVSEPDNCLNLETKSIMLKKYLIRTFRRDICSRIEELGNSQKFNHIFTHIFTRCDSKKYLGPGDFV